MRVNPNFFVVRISKDLQKKKKNKMTASSIGYLGIKYSDAENEKGFLISTVEKDSPAFYAGFKYGDIITDINGKKVTDHTSLIAAVTKFPPGSTLHISYINSFSVNNEVSVKDVVLDERPLELDIPSGTQDMRFNLQFGEIVAIGTKASVVFPDANIGDQLIFHHNVEYKERAEGDENWNDWHLLQADDLFEYRIAHCEKEVMGVWKPSEKDLSKAIIPYPDFIFCHQSYKKAEFQIINGIWQPEDWDNSMETANDQLAEFKAQIEELNTSSIMGERDNDANYKQKEFIKKRIDEIDRERLALTKKMHQKRLVEVNVIFINYVTNENCLVEIIPGDKIVVDYFTLYPLDLAGAHYVLVRPQSMEALIKN